MPGAEEIEKQESHVESIQLPNEAAKSEPLIDAAAAKKPTAFSIFMSGFSFVRAVGLSGYSIYSAVMALENPEYQKYDSAALFIVTIIALSFDILFTIFRTFPAILKSLNLSENLAKIFPFLKASGVGIWSLILDKDMVMDMLTPMINAILKVYSYRFTEILSNPNATDSLANAGGTANGNYSGNAQTDIANSLNDQGKINFILLLLFGLTLVYLIIYHSFRIAFVVGKRGSYEFGAFLVIKGLLLIFNIVASAFFLYEALVPRRLDLFRNDNVTNFALAVIVPSSVVSLMSNCLVNFPMHYYYLKITKTEKVKKNSPESPPSSVGFKQLFTEAAYNAFMHPLNALVFGGYSVFP